MDHRAHLRGVTGTALLLAVAAVWAPGCTTTRKTPKSDRKVGVVQNDKAAVIGTRAAARLRLLSAYGRGLDLYQQGKREQGLAVLVDVAEEAAEHEIAFSDDVEANLDRALKGEAPLIKAQPAAQPSAAGPDPDTTPAVTPASPIPRKRRIIRARKPQLPTRQPVQSKWAGQVRMPRLDQPGMREKSITFNFNQVDMKMVIKTVGELTGVNFLIDRNVRGTVTLIAPSEIRLGDVYTVFESILETHGYAAVPAGDVVKVMPRAEAVKRNLNTRVGGDPSRIPESDALIKQIIPLKHASAAELSRIVTPMISTGGNVTLFTQSNAILVTDTSANIHQIAKIVRELDVPGDDEELTVFPLRFASATALSQQVTQLMQQQARVTATRGRRSVPRDAGGPKILPDARTNSLIVMASPRETQTVEDLVKALDVERPIESSNIHVVYLENAEANKLVQSLSTAVRKAASAKGGKGIEPTQITADEGTNALIITASPQDFKVIHDMIRKLDIPREQVLVEMRIMEISEDVMNQLGVEWSTFDQPKGGETRLFGMAGYGLSVEALSGDLEGMAVGAFRQVGDIPRIGFLMHALAQNSKVNILSTPHILTSNHQQAEIIVGANVPFVKESRVTETDPSNPTVIKSFDYRDVGISLKITPHVSHLRRVRMLIETQFTKLIEGAAGTTADTPTTSKREAKTMVNVQSGSTVVIGGLMGDEKVETEKKIPLLGDIPYLGFLFRLKRVVPQKTNLLFFITPHVLIESEDFERMSERKRTEAFPDRPAEESDK